MGRQTSGTPASPGTSRRAAQYGVTLPRRLSKDKISVVTKPAEDVPQPTNVPVVNNHEDTPTPESPSVTSMSCECTNVLEYFFSMLYGLHGRSRSLCNNTALANIANLIHSSLLNDS